MTVTIDAPFPHRDDLGEGPHWHAETQTLLRVDIVNGLIHRLAPGTGEQRTVAVPGQVGFAIATTGDALVIGRENEIELLDDDGSRVHLTSVEGRPGEGRINDGKCDPQGRLVFGTMSMATPREDTKTLYRLDSTNTPERLFGGIIVSNGLGWDTARSRFYHVDTIAQRIDVMHYDADTGAVTDRRVFATFDEHDGLPDGLALDVDGGVWVALFGGGEVRRYAPSGEVTQSVLLPVTHPTSIAFGGQDLRTAFVTTSRHRLDDDQRAQQPLAGAVLTFDAGVQGASVPSFQLP